MVRFSRTRHCLVLILFLTITAAQGQVVVNTFPFTGTTQVFAVPPCVTTISVDLRGAAGGNPFDIFNNSSAGLGGRITGVMTVTPGQTLTVMVGGQGSASGTGGFNGGGTGGLSVSNDTNCPGGYAGGGGGASDIRIGGTGLTNRAVVAAGGGGAGRDYCNGTCLPCGCGGSGGHGGGIFGSVGGAAYNCGFLSPGLGVNGGGGATAISGGPGGVGDAGGASGSSGSLGAGGTGAGGQYDVAGGGGGGGYYGGGGGGGALSGSGVGGGGGGGGASFASLTVFLSSSTSAGFQSGNGLVVISYNNPGTNVSAQAAPSSKCFGTSSVTLTAGGAITYTWGHGPLLAASVVSPTISTIYTVTGVNAQGCVSTATVMVEVISPTLTATSSTPAACPGSTLALTGNAPGHTITWHTSASGGTPLGSSVSSASFVTTATAGTGFYATAVNTGTTATVTFAPTGSIQTFTVPQYVTRLDIDARGAGGGSVSITCAASGGLGARMRGSFNVTPGQVLSLLVGEQGETNGEDAGGGGGSFVATGTVPLVVAGGGGGATNNIQSCGSNRNGINASITTFATASADGLVAGGAPGNGGGANTGSGSGGGGFYTNGMGGNGNPNGAGRSFLNGGAGGSGITFDDGGFGGGGSGWHVGGNGGGGGGYSGGGTNGGQPYSGGGGGGSFNSGYNQVNTSGFQAGDGLVIITYTVPGGCSSGTRVAVAFTTQPLPVITATASAAAICAGGTVALNASGANTYTWISGHVNGVPFTPASTATYSVFGTSTAGCTSTTLAGVTVSVNPLPVITISPNSSVCAGGSRTLTASGAHLFTWSTGPTATSVVVSPAATTVYTVLGTNTLTGCSITATTTVSVTPLPNITASSGSICSGQTYTIIPGGGVAYAYSSGSQFVSPSANTSYTVTGFAATTCSNTAVSNVTVHARPTVSATSGTICAGQSFNIATSGASTYSITGGSFNVFPTITTAYSVTGTSSIGCQSSNTAVATVTVHARPTISAPNGSICTGGSFLISPTGASTYTISGGSFNVSPSATTSYSVTGTSTAGCISSNTAVLSVAVHALPTVSANSGTICLGRSFTIVPTGASTYTITGGTFTVSPASNTSYSVTGTSSAGCISSNTAVSTITVNPLPVVGATSGSICAGQAISIIPSGASTYTITGGSFNVSPATTTAYSVTGTNSIGCVSSNTAVSTITVHARPLISAPGGSICSGGTFVIGPSGASTYTVTGNNFTVSPAINTSYSVTGTSTAGCLSSNTAIATVTVHALPVIASNSGSICSGSAFTIVPSGASAYTVTGGSFVVSPLTNTSYSVTGTSSVGCPASNTAISTVTVNALPVVSVPGGTICAGQSFSIVPAGALNYAITGNTFNVNPPATTSYSVTGTDGNGCIGETVVTVTVHALPQVGTSASSSVVCTGNTVSLAGTGAETYTWTPPINDGIGFTPTVTTSYQVLGTSSAGCTGTNQAVVTITVNPLPVVNASASSTAICTGGTISLNATGALSYSWVPAAANNATFIPGGSGQYTVTGTDANSCSASATVVVVVHPLPTVAVTASSGSTCPGETFTLQASGADTYLWNDNQAGPLVVTSPMVTTSFGVQGTSAKGCTATATYTQLVIDCPATILTQSLITQISCGNKRDGRAVVNTVVSYPLHTIRYLWEPANLCQDLACAAIDSLAPGSYSLTLLVTYTVNNNYARTDTIVMTPFEILKATVGCTLEIFTGITANNDGVNDFWYIGSIEEFPDNHVWIYNRWGALVFETKGYDNYSRYWPAHDLEVPPGTYFYIIDPGNGSPHTKGWVELLKN